MEAKKLDEARVAVETGLHLRTIERYVARDDSPNRRANVEAIADVLDVSADWLETGEGEMDAESVKRNGLPGGGRPKMPAAEPSERTAEATRADGPALIRFRLPNGSVLALSLAQVLHGPPLEIEVDTDLLSSDRAGSASQATPKQEAPTG